MTVLVAIDESSGVQNTTQGGVTSNDTSVALPLRFQDALAAEGAGSGTLSLEAVSGSTSSSSTGTNVLTFGANVTDVGFTNGSGDDLAGLDSGLTTTSGGHIFLYTSSFDNNVVLGRVGTFNGTTWVANSSGTVAFAAFLDTGVTNTSGDGDLNATGAKLWLTQFQPLYHPDATNANDVDLLTGKLYVTVNNASNFSLAGAPSGQNAFLMFGDPSFTGANADKAAVIVTGRDPTHDTVNTGQGGGMTTIGTNNQMIDPTEGMYFTFVKGPDPNYTVPNLDQNEADLEADILFDSYLPSSGASFVLSQLQPPKAATVKVTAYTDPTLEKGVGFYAGYADDQEVNITSITITRLDKKGNPGTPVTLAAASGSVSDSTLGVSADFTGNTVTITGLKAGDTIAYVVAGDHNRVLIENAGNANANLNAAFDIGNFQITAGGITQTPLGDMAFVDDAPMAAASLGTGSVVNDETAGVQSAAGANDTTSSTVIALFSGVTNTSTQLASAEYAQGSASVIDSSAGVFGADGAAASNATVYSLAVASAGVSSGLTTDDGTAILLYKEGSLVVGRIGSALGAAAFAVAIDASTGILSMAQYSAVKHADTTNANDSTNVTNAALQAVVTLTDGDGDQSTASVNIGSQVKILDDGPTAGATLGAGSVVNDETAGVQSAAGANDTTSSTVIALFSGVTNTSTQLAAAEYAQGTASVIDSSSTTFGVDGAAAANSVVYSLAVSAAGVNSGLTNDAGTAILLYKEGSLVVGRLGSASGAAALAVAIDASTGVLSMAQYSAVKHANTADANDAASISSTALQAVVTVKDGDGDTSTASVNIGNAVTILDDGPTLAFGNVIGTGAIDPQYGYWGMAPGVDGLGANGVNMALDSFQLVKPDSTLITGSSSTFTETAPSPDINGAYHFTGSLTGDFDNNAGTADTTEHFTVTVYANGTYAIDLVEGFKSTTTESTANGTLDAGGPDPVRTLTIGSDSVVFFAAKPLASASDLMQGIGLDTPNQSDPTEAQLQTNPLPSYIDGTAALNVSTSGIGNGNNNLDGDANSNISAGDESFVANPGTQFTSAKVFVDNSVTGYNYTGGERLYYRLFFTDGTDSGQQLVVGNVATTGSKPVPFTVDGGGKLIDAIQLTMATGTVKIPEIQFITQTNNLADGIKLGFTATIADGDGDTASSSFVTNLAANALGTSFDYVLNGITGKVDAFNVDLAPPENKYQVNGFEVGSDKLVLLGANSYTLNTSTADTVVDVTETNGGQHTTVTVVGVHISATDIATIV